MPIDPPSEHRHAGLAEAPDDTPQGPRRRIALNTAIFSVATGFSRIAGLIREVVASSYFGTSGPMSAFTLAFQVPNLIRSLFADSALSAAFVPVFTELLETKRRKEAFQLAGALFGLILTVLTAITVVFMLAAGVIMPLFTGPEFSQQLDDLTVGLSRVVFPILVLLGLNGLLVGILNAYDEFTVPALIPLVWNVVIIVALVTLRPLFEGPDELYAYAIGVLAGTVVQFLMAIPPLRRVGFPLQISFNWRDERVARILKLMLPVTIGLGLINFNLLINSILGSRVSEEAPSAIDRAFRIYMLPQGMFSVAVATVLFPALSRFAARRDMDGLRRTQANGIRQIALLLIPAAAATIALAEPITRLVYQRGDFDAESTRQTAEALFWFSFSLPFAGANLLLTRTYFSLQQPWTPTALAGVTLSDQHRRVGRALRAAGHRRRRHRHRRGQRGDDDRPGVLPAPQAPRHRTRHDAHRNGEDAPRRRAARGPGLRRLVRPRPAARPQPARADRLRGNRAHGGQRRLRRGRPRHAHPRGPPDPPAAQQQTRPQG